MEQHDAPAGKMGTLIIVAPGAQGPEQVTDLETTAHELLFVLADHVAEREAKALADCKARLRADGKAPFFIRVCHADGADAPVQEGSFDAAVSCGCWKDLPLRLPVEIISALLRRGPIDLDEEEILPILRRSGPMSCFEKSISWEGRPREELEKLCNELGREVALAHDRFGDSLWVFVQLICSLGIGLEEVERCIEQLAESGDERNYLRFQYEFQNPLPDNTLVVRGLIGAMDEEGESRE